MAITVVIKNGIDPYTLYLVNPLLLFQTMFKVEYGKNQMFQIFWREITNIIQMENLSLSIEPSRKEKDFGLSGQRVKSIIFVVKKMISRSHVNQALHYGWSCSSTTVQNRRCEIPNPYIFLFICGIYYLCGALIYLNYSIRINLFVNVDGWHYISKFYVKTLFCFWVLWASTTRFKPASDSES